MHMNTHVPLSHAFHPPPPQMADFNFDGLQDLLMVGSGGVYAWAQVR